MWYMGIAKGEITKPLQFWNETLLILTFLTVRGIETKISYIVIAYFLVFFAFIAIGKIIVELGIVKYQTMLGNSQNNELLEILERIKRIENKIK